MKQKNNYSLNCKTEKIYHERNDMEFYVGCLEEKYISCTMHSTVWVSVSKETIDSPSAIAA